MNMKFLLQFAEKSECTVTDGIGAFVLLKDKKPDVKVKFDLKVSKDGSNKNFYEVKMIFNIVSTVEDKNLYTIDFVYTALIQIDETDGQSFAEEQIKKMLMVDSPKLLFPFARAEVANLVRSAGFMNLMLEPIDFDHLFEKHNNDAANQQ